MSEKKTLSIITVCYNAAEDLKKTMESVLAQTFCDYEYIIQDGGSTDSTSALVEQYSELFKKRGISLTFVSEKDGGIYDAMNRALQHCNGKWVQYMNAGDYYHSEQVLEHVFQGDIIADTTVLFGNSIEWEAGHEYFLEGRVDNLLEKDQICHQSSFIDREWMCEQQYDTGYRIAADYNFFLGTYFAEKKFQKLEQVVSVFVKDGVSSTQELQRVRETQEVRSKYGLIEKDSKEYKKKIRAAAFKQWILDYTPKWFSDFLRRVRRKTRKR